MLVVDGYVRPVRTDGLRTLNCSQIQRSQISAWATDHGWRMAKIFEESPQSDGTDGTGPVLRRALHRVESGESDGIVVSRLTLLGRSLAEALAAIERIEAAGGTFVSVADGIDLTQPAGRGILRLLLSVVDW